MAELFLRHAILFGIVRVGLHSRWRVALGDFQRAHRRMSYWSGLGDLVADVRRAPLWWTYRPVSSGGIVGGIALGRDILCESDTSSHYCAEREHEKTSLKVASLDLYVFTFGMRHSRILLRGAGADRLTLDFIRTRAGSFLLKP